jgi:hypothetical protein
MTKLTVKQFVEQLESENFDYALASEIITCEGIVDENQEAVLCSGTAIFNFINEDPDFDGVFTTKKVKENIEIMDGLS